MTQVIMVALVAGFTAIGLLVGMAAWRIYIAFRRHPCSDEVIRESQRVVLDITQLTQRGHS